MSGKISYFGRDGKLLQREEWSRLRESATYVNVRLYQNKDVRVHLEWLGVVTDAVSTFPEYRKTFILHVKNAAENGTWRDDPVEDGKTFGSEKAAVDAYEKFLLVWTHSQRENGKFIEVDNELTPPPPPDPDVLTSDLSKIKGIGSDDCGAW